jgi:hypothetical protein
MYEQIESDGSRSLQLLPLTPAGGVYGKPALYLKTDGATATLAHFSPDGKWVAYYSTETGSSEVYIQSFPTLGSRIQVSNNGGGFPRWRKDGKEIFYRATDGKLMVAAVRDQGGRLEVGTPLRCSEFLDFFRRPLLSL